MDWKRGLRKTRENRSSLRDYQGELDVLVSIAGGAAGSFDEMWTEPRDRGCMMVQPIEEYRFPGSATRPEGAKKLL